MAGGEGTRLRPLTCNLPKPMVPVLNRPMMEHILNLLKKYQLTEIANTLWYMPEVIQDYFGDGSEWNVAMHYFIEDKPLGTAGSVKNAQKFLDEAFVVISGDSLTDIDLNKAIHFHREKGALATLVLTKVANPLSYGVVITNEQGRITQFLEKPSWSQVFSDTVNTGIYILEPEVLNYIPQETKYDFSQDLFPKLLQMQAPLFGYVAEGYWSDVGSLEVYRQAQQDCLDQKVEIQMPREIQPQIWAEADVLIADDAVIFGPVYLGKGVQIGSEAQIGAYTVLGDNSQIAPGATIKRSTLWRGCRVGENTNLRGVVMASNATVEAVVDAYEGSVIGEKTQVGQRSIVAPNVKIWPGKKIASGARLNDSVIWGNQEAASIFSKTGIKGDLRSTLTPELIVKIGLAYGAFIGAGKELIVSNDQSTISKIAKRALIAGLLAAGVKVLDVGTVVGNLTRFGIKYLGTAGALHCRSVAEASNIVNIQCWDNDGFWLGKTDERKIENLLWREDYPRASHGQLGELVFVPGLVDQYINSLVKIYQQSLRGLSVQLVNQGKSPQLATIMEDFLNRVGCLIDPENGQLIIEVSDDGWVLKNHQGLALSDDSWWDIYLHSLAARRLSSMAVPVHVSSRVANSAAKNQINLHWTKQDPRSWMEIASELGNYHVEEETEIDHFPYIEPLVSLAEALSYLKQDSQVDMDFWQSRTPVRVERSVFCPWEAKGTVMRKLIHAAEPSNTSFLDGLKYHTEQGWVLVVPDGDDPVFHIQSEADSQEEADRLTDYYTAVIEGIIREEEKSIEG